MRNLVVASALLGRALAQSGAWAQCGGTDFNGQATCVSGYTCVVVNQWYSQCQPGSNPGNPVPSTTTGGSSPTSAAGKFTYLGANEAGAEFGTGTFPGTWGKDFIFPDTSAIQTLISQGYNAFRVAFYMERLVPDNMSGSPSADYLANLTATVDFITNAGAYAVIDPHNFGRYYDSIISDTAGFKAFWQTLAGQFKDNARVIFDTNNEYHDMDQALVLSLNQAAIDGIRAAGATSQTIFAEGNSWSGAWTWEETNNNLAALVDPEDKLVYEMHQYLDVDGSGTSEACVSGTIGAERLAGATRWLRANGKVGVLGEFAGGANDVCRSAVKGVLDHLQENSDVWSGAFWWAAGPWWGDYMYGFEPPSGTGYSYYNDLLKGYAP